MTVTYNEIKVFIKGSKRRIKNFLSKEKKFV